MKQGLRAVTCFFIYLRRRGRFIYNLGVTACGQSFIWTILVCGQHVVLLLILGRVMFMMESFSQCSLNEFFTLRICCNVVHLTF